MKHPKRLTISEPILGDIEYISVEQLKEWIINQRKGLKTITPFPSDVLDKLLKFIDEEESIYKI